MRKINQNWKNGWMQSNKSYSQCRFRWGLIWPLLLDLKEERWIRVIEVDSSTRFIHLVDPFSPSQISLSPPLSFCFPFSQLTWEGGGDMGKTGGRGEKGMEEKRDTEHLMTSMFRVMDWVRLRGKTRLEELSYQTCGIYPARSWLWTRIHSKQAWRIQHIGLSGSYFID